MLSSYLWNNSPFFSNAAESPFSIFRNHLDKYRNQNNFNVTSERYELDIDENKYEIHLNVQEYDKENIKIKTLNNILVVEFQQNQDKNNNSYAVKKFYIPQWYDIKKAKSSISDDGILTVHVPRSSSIEERNVPIVRANLDKPKLKSKL